MSEIVGHLQAAANVAIGKFYSLGSETLMLRAADEILRLRAALEPFAKFYDALADGDEFSEVALLENGDAVVIEMSDLRRAREALNRGKDT